MVHAVRQGKEIVVTAENKVGIMATISRALADHGINIEAVAGYVAEGKAKLMVVVDDALRGSEAIRKAGFADAKEHEVIVLDLENRPGALKSAAARLAEANIDIRYMYGTACPDGCPARIIMNTTNDEKALVLLTNR